MQNTQGCSLAHAPAGQFLHGARIVMGETFQGAASIQNYWVSLLLCSVRIMSRKQVNINNRVGVSCSVNGAIK